MTLHVSVEGTEQGAAMPQIDIAAPAATREEVTTKSPLDIAVDKTVAEAGCTPVEAETMITDWLCPILERSREGGGGMTYVYDEEMFDGYHGSTVLTKSYQIFDSVLSHGETSTADSAHEAIEKAVLKPELNEFSLIHSQTEGRVQHCYVATHIGAVSGLSS